MKKNLLGIGLLALIVTILVTVFVVFREKPKEGNASNKVEVENSEEGNKSIKIEVVNSKEESIIYELKTDALYLKEAMEESEGLEFTIEGTMVMSVNGEEAIYAENGAYWSFYVNDQYCNYGIEEQPVEDGDYFKIVYEQ